jgi:hypothetical protein
MRESLTRLVPLDLEHDWKIILNGHSVAASEFAAVHPNFGALSWGVRPEGTVSWVWEEIGGGGVGIVPYVIMGGRLMIGISQRERAPMPGGLAWNIPRGFLEPGLTHFESAEREMAEELGLNTMSAGLKELPGEEANCNSTFFDIHAGGGVRFYSLAVPQSLLDCAHSCPVFRRGLFTPKSAAAERILQCQFVHWRAAARMADTFTNAGVARLIASDDRFLQNLE